MHTYNLCLHSLLLGFIYKLKSHWSEKQQSGTIFIIIKIKYGPRKFKLLYCNWYFLHLKKLIEINKK